MKAFTMSGGGAYSRMGLSPLLLPVNASLFDAEEYSLLS